MEPGWLFMTDHQLCPVGGPFGAMIENATTLLLGVTMKLDCNRIKVPTGTWLVLEIAK
mgnify:FL=1